MKIAVASTGAMTTEHFGHCENFNIFDAENGVITGHESIPNPGHKPGFLPNYLGDLGVNVVISGGMGQGATIFSMRVASRSSPAQLASAEDCAKRYLAGELVSTGSVCHKHEHADECGGHHHGHGHAE